MRNRHLARYKNIMKGYNIPKPDKLLTDQLLVLIHIGGEDLYDILKALPEE